MKKIFFLLCFSVLMGGCTKFPLSDINDYFPKIELVSASLQTDGTVLVIGKVESEGASGLEYLGFCTSTSKEPKIQDRQLRVSSIDSSGLFSAVYSGGFNADSTYYFRAWGINNHGNSISNTIIPVSNIIAAPVTPPCTLTANTCDIGGETSNINKVTTPTLIVDNWQVVAKSWSGPTFTLLFGSALTTGIYTTTTSTSVLPMHVNVSFYSGFISGYLKGGTKVYVNRLSTNVHTVTICTTPFVSNVGNNITMNLQFKTPL